MPLLPSLAGALLALLIDGPFNYEFSRATDEKGEAYLIVRANENLPALEVTILGDRQTIKKQLPPLKAGKEHKIVWTQNSPTAAYNAKIVAGSSEGEFGFEVARGAGKAGSTAAGKITALATAEDLVYKHQAIYQASFDVSGFTFEVYDTDGDVIHKDQGSGGWSAGERITLKWDRPEDVFLVKVHFDGASGQFGDHILAPMAIEIPHTEVVFDSGKAIIKGEQSPKLDEAAAVAMHKLDSVERAKAAVGNMLAGSGYVAKLYISGYTDTVGQPGKNQTLSEQRAKAIADYFVSKGVWSEIWFTGMGERGQKVQTGDSVDEEKNRRAVYVISFQPPTGAWFPSPGAWKRAAGARKRPGELPPYPEKWKQAEAEKRGSSGSSSGGSDAGSGGSGGDSSDGGGSSDGGSGGSGGEPRDPDMSHTYGQPYTGSAEEPPPVEGTPGATKKGCSVADDGGQLPGALIVLLAGIVGRRRRR
ncbi:MAG: OmpA family protein [Myxococcales bacterium]|nr:OmpA family protein [Myxococcales bacterium]